MSDVDVKKVQKKASTSLAEDMMLLMYKIFAIFVIFVLLFSFVFGIHRTSDMAMSPSVKDGDLVIYYRLDKKYQAGDTVVLKTEAGKSLLRVVAVEGDIVDITKDGFFVNGYLQHDVGEIEITTRTERYEAGVDFPLTVGSGEIFVLGDNRITATDSRIFGAINASDTQGSVMMVVRMRGI